jgi:branched-subunit amino acid ABC-type transport system permease component
VDRPTLVVVAALQFFARTLTGMAMRAVALNRFAAALMGINIKAMVACSLAMAGAVGGGRRYLTPTLTAWTAGTLLGLKGFSAAIVGGLGSGRRGRRRPAAWRGVGQRGLRVLRLQDAIAFLLLIVMLLVRPRGCSAHGSPGRRDEARRARSSSSSSRCCPRVMTSGYHTIMVFAGIHVLLALGLNLVMGYTGRVSLGHAAFYGVGAYGSGRADHSSG